MERTTQKQDDQLLQYLDGTFTGKDKAELENLLLNNTHLKIRLEELRKVHTVLSNKARLEQPSKLFTDKVMHNLDRLPVRSTLSSKNGLLLLLGILVAAGVTAFGSPAAVLPNMPRLSIRTLAMSRSASSWASIL